MQCGYRRRYLGLVNPVVTGRAPSAPSVAARGAGSPCFVLDFEREVEAAFGRVAVLATLSRAFRHRRVPGVHDFTSGRDLVRATVASKAAATRSSSSARSSADRLVWRAFNSRSRACCASEKKASP